MDTKEIKRRAAESYRVLAEIILANAGLEAVNPHRGNPYRKDDE